MDILYLSTCCSEQLFSRLFSLNKIKPYQAPQKFNSMFMKGFIKNNIRVTSLSYISNTKVKYQNEMENNIKYIYIRCLNIKYIKNLIIYIKSFIQTCKWIKKNKNGYIFYDSLNLSLSSGSLLAAKLFRCKTTGIVTDIVGIDTDSYKQRSIFNKLLYKYSQYLFSKNIKKFNSFVFLTEDMNKCLNKKNKPYVVIEGMVDENIKLIDIDLNKKSYPKILLYAGSLEKVYGIEMLIRSFIEISNNEYELHIYGHGEMESEIKEYCVKHSNVKYFGVVKNDIVIKKLVEATLLINPRPINYDYVRYSFPSKNIEYMSSGTPLITTQLPGMPKDYYKYIYLIDSSTQDKLVDCLRPILEIDSIQHHNLGNKARNYMINNKTAEKQVLKIINKLNMN